MDDNITIIIILFRSDLPGSEADREGIIQLQNLLPAGHHTEGCPGDYWPTLAGTSH